MAHPNPAPAVSPLPHRPSAVETYLDAVRRSAGPHVYVSFLGLNTFDTSTVHEKVQQGLSFGALEKLARVMELPMSMAAEVLQIRPRTLQRRREEGRLRPDESDRLVRLSRLYGKAVELFEGNNEAAIQWFGAPAPALGDVSPILMSQTEPGSREVENLIGRLEHGVFS